MAYYYNICNLIVLYYIYTIFYNLHRIKLITKQYKSICEYTTQLFASLISYFKKYITNTAPSVRKIIGMI